MRGILADLERRSVEAARCRVANLLSAHKSIYLVLFRIGDFEVTSFGVMVAVAALVGLWLFRRELRLIGTATRCHRRRLFRRDRWPRRREAACGRSNTRV